MEAWLAEEAVNTLCTHLWPCRRRHFRLGPLLAAAAIAATLGGCATAPKPLSPDELDRINLADRTTARGDIPPLTAPLTLEEAIARALKYNTQHRIRILEQALALGQLDASRFDVLPKLLANAGYTWRDEENIREAIDSVTGQPSLANPYISSERSRVTADIGLTWNLLDFGASYYTAQQNADRLLVAGERRRKAMHTLIQEVRTVYWRAVAAQQLGHLVKATIKEAEQALAFSRKIAEERVRSPGEALRYQRNLLENLRLLENVDRELSAARIELADLIGAPIGSQILLAEPPAAQPVPLELPVERMEELALSQNAELREEFYNVRIATLETRKALMKLLPGISFDYGINYDDDKYLINQKWQDAGLTVSYNLFNLLSAPSRMKVAEMGVKLAEARRMALQMALLTKVHLARHQYEDAMRQWQRAEAIYDVDRRLSDLALSREKTQTAGNLDRIAANVTAILSSVRRYHAMAKVQEAASRVQASLGVEPRIGALDDIELPELKEQIQHFLERWANTAAPGQPPGAVQSEAEAPANSESSSASPPDEPVQHIIKTSARVELSVMTPVLDDEAAAQAVIAKLSKAGLSDFYLHKMPGGKRRVYLGTYYSKFFANKRLRELEAADIDAVTQPSRASGDSAISPETASRPLPPAFLSRSEGQA